MTKLTNKDAERLNPCLKEQEASYQCLNKNNFNQEKCEGYFDNYNTCKHFWAKIYKERKAQGLYPYLPDVSERAKIKEAYVQSVKSSLPN